MFFYDSDTKTCFLLDVFPCAIAEPNKKFTMTSLALTLDNVDVSENTEQISKLFPKCRPRSDINLNPVISLGRNDDHIDNTLATIMNIEKDNNRYYKDN